MPYDIAEIPHGYSKIRLESEGNTDGVDVFSTFCLWCASDDQSDRTGMVARIVWEKRETPYDKPIPVLVLNRDETLRLAADMVSIGQWILDHQHTVTAEDFLGSHLVEDGAVNNQLRARRQNPTTTDMAGVA